MTSFRIEFHSGGLYLPQLGLWLDTHEPQLGPERVFVSHAHSDHTAAHREVILSAPTAKLMEARLPGVRHEHVLNFGETRRFEQQESAFELTLLRAGHIFGSAMALVQAESQSLIYTGDLKLRRSMSAERCEPRHADFLVMETTYGRSHYVFPPTDAVLQGVIRFCREALDNDETAVLLGYSLGKSQELLCGLGDAGLPLMLHGAVFKLTQIYEQFGQCFPTYERYEAGAARGKVLLCPPNVINSAMLRNLGKTRCAILTGWAVDPNCRYRYQCDAAFPLSDHADFSELLEMVKRVQPKRIYTLHGFAADFAQTLRELGYDAQALSQNEQFMLRLPSEGMGQRPKDGGFSREGHETRPVSEHFSSADAGFPCDSAGKPGKPDALQTLREKDDDPFTPDPVEPPGVSSHQTATDSFLGFCLTCSNIAKDTRKLEKVRMLAEYLRSLSGNSVALTATWFTGRPFPPSQNKVLQLGWAVIRDALGAAGNIDELAFHQIYLKHSDVGETAAEVLQHRQLAPTLSLEQVNHLFEKLLAARGPLAKTPLLKATLESCSPLEAKYLLKIITGDLRIGLKAGLVEEGVAGAFHKSPEEVRQADLLLGDIGKTAILASENRLSEASLTPFRPIKFMLASPEETANAIWERVGDRMVASDSTLEPKPVSSKQPSPQLAEGSPPVWLEDKYDGIRCQLHKVGARVSLYSRDLKEITTTFLDLTDAVRNMAADFILDGEIVAMRGDQILPFAELQKRLGRRESDLFMREEVPIKYVAFDLFWLAGVSQLNRPLRDRRRALESLAPFPATLRLAHITEAKSVDQIETAFDSSRTRGNEGLMIKDPVSIYTPGRRGLAWLKLKKAFATLDCVVVGAEYGHGKRSKVLSDYTFAVRDEQTGELKIIGKAYTGLTDAEIAHLTEHFLKTASHQHGRYFDVPPDTVLEIAFDKIQRSDRHNSGLAMRFPRIVRIRTDKSADEIDKLAAAQRLVAP